MIRNAKKIAVNMLAGAVGALVMTLAAHQMLNWQMQAEVEEDLNVSAKLMLERATDATQTAIDLLNRLAQSTGLSCVSDSRFLYSEATRSTAWIDTIGLVDRSGNLVCTDLGQSSRQAGLLSAYKANGPDVTLSLSASGRPDRMPSLLVARHITNGRRLVARIPGELIRIDPVRHDLRRYRVAMLSLGAGNPWYIHEAIERSGDAVVRVHENSDYLPFEVDISISEAAIDAVTRHIRGLVNGLGMVIGLLAMFGGYKRARYKETEADHILSALDRGEFIPFMQPIIDLDNGAITGCEILTRWHKPDGTTVSPMEFIPVANSYRLSREITCHIMEATRDLVEPLIQAAPDFKFSFNLFTSQLADDTIVGDIRDTFRNSPIGFENLVFEISDRMPISDFPLANDVISQIQALGAEIALDDVGSGHSGLYNLTTIEVDIVKLDKLLVDSLDHGAGGKELMLGLIGLAEKMKIGMIAEGVETEGQAVQLRKMGISAAQGYLFAPPMPGTAFVELYLASHGAKARRASAEQAERAAALAAAAEAGASEQTDAA